jgi:hypothetical protein
LVVQEVEQEVITETEVRGGLTICMVRLEMVVAAAAAPLNTCMLFLVAESDLTFFTGIAEAYLMIMVREEVGE